MGCLIQLPGPWELPRHRVTQQRGGEAGREREGLPQPTRRPPPALRLRVPGPGEGSACIGRAGVRAGLCGQCQATGRPGEDPGAGGEGVQEPGASRTAGLGLPWATARPQARPAGGGDAGLGREVWPPGRAWSRVGERGRGAPGTLGGPCLWDEWGLFLLHPPAPGPPGRSPHPAPSGTVGSGRAQEPGLDKGFLQLSLRTPHLAGSHGTRARPLAPGPATALSSPSVPDTKASRQLPVRVSHASGPRRGSRRLLKTRHLGL